MSDPTLSITISRTLVAGSPAPLALSGHDSAATLWVVRFRPPAKIRRNEYAEQGSPFHGSELTGSSLDHGLLGFHFTVNGAASETALQAAVDEMETALAQPWYDVTTQISGAPPQVWEADPGSCEIAGEGEREYLDLANLNTVYAVTIPVYPIPGSA
ncbi:MAG TPA: hypothetical protein VJL80_09760 [Aeromicrobium sp.]|nr:hypothetical protein [Aeromicrobium sp.]HKY58311.1 hypothetical protein [Aeromicrobium sp.]